MEEKREIIDRQVGDVHVTEERRAFHLRSAERAVDDIAQRTFLPEKVVTGRTSDFEHVGSDHETRTPPRSPRRVPGEMQVREDQPADRLPRPNTDQLAKAGAELLQQHADTTAQQTGAPRTDKKGGSAKSGTSTGAKKTIMGLLLSPFMLAVLVGGLAVWYFTTMKPANMPPGPSISLPFLGYVPFLGTYPWIELAKMNKTYGNIMTVRLGPLGFNYGTMLSVVLNDYDAIKAALADKADEFEGRADDSFTEYLSTGKDGKIHGIMKMEGKKFYAQHNFIVNTLRELGVNGSRMDKLILEEFDHLAAALTRHGQNGKVPLNALSDFKQATMNTVSMVTFGKRYDYEGKGLQSWSALAQTGVEVMLGAWLRRLGFPDFIVGKVRNLSKDWAVIGESLDAHQETYQAGKKRDFLDVYIQLHKEGKDTEGLLAMADQNDIIASIDSMFQAGPEATGSILQYAILHHLRNPGTQEKLQRELARVVGTRKHITYADKDNLPYMSSTMFEVVRVSGETPLGQARENLKEAELMGYTIPPKTQIVPNYWAVHWSPKYFPDPESFKPDRFMTEDGTSFSLPPQFLHWSKGLGRRSCPGMELAQQMLWVLMANLFHNFEFSVPPGETLPGIHEYSLLLVSHRPKPFNVLVKPRNL
ncbi:hypothetical protein RvY_19256 [Ramazzottius varieornatus]|uniref:Cytochrome P450 n=1 Tax=Ramazzottius varieornatus TaxID=947166 RepID=A0A1D1W8S6_RAMVA|nr:hypothetical protein RvY_19256 [Ramazzottius varieornatus]